MARVQTRVIVAIAGIICGWGGLAKASSTVLNINFSGDTVGQPPAASTSATTPPITEPYGIGGYDYDPDPNGGAYESPPTAADGTILVNNSHATDWVTNSADNQLGSLWMDTEFAVPTNTYNLTFDLTVNHGSTTTGQPSTLATNSSTVYLLFSCNTFTNTESGGDNLRFTAWATSPTTGSYGIRIPDGVGGYKVEPFFNYNNGDAHTVSLEANLAAGTVTALVDGTPELTNFVFNSTPAANSTVFETFFNLNGNVGDANSITLGNIVSTVPEPASLGILAVGGLLTLSRRRRRTVA